MVGMDERMAAAGLTIEETADQTGITRHTLPATMTSGTRLHGHLAAIDNKIGVYTTALETEKESA